MYVPLSNHALHSRAMLYVHIIQRVRKRLPSPPNFTPKVGISYVDQLNVIAAIRIDAMDDTRDKPIGSRPLRIPGAGVGSF